MIKDNTAIEENKMGIMPVNKLLITMSLPMMVSMLVQALYNIVDSVFVSMISENALTAVSMAFPIQTLMIAFAGGTTVGVNALLSRSLGEKEFVRANKTAANGIFLAAVGCVAFFIVGIFGSRPFFMSQTEVSEIIIYGTDYLTVCCCASVGVFMQFIFEKLLQSTGKTFYTMITQGVGAVVNLILDPVFIFGYLGVPAMGVRGAAIATVIGQIVAAILAAVFNFKYNKEIHISFKGFKPDFKIIGTIYQVGLPSIIMQSIGSVMTYGMNRILVTFTETATAVFGVYFKLQSFIFMPVFGLNNGMVPIIAYNYGAGKKSRVTKTIRLSIIYAVAIMLLGLAVMELFPHVLLGFFNASDNMLAIGVPALRTICLSFVFAGYCIVAGSVFQALGNGVYSMLVSIARQLLVLLPVAYFLSKLCNVDYVWWAFPIAELMSLALTTVFLVIINRNIISKIGINNEITDADSESV